MKIIEAMKKIKYLDGKRKDLIKKINSNCSEYDINTPTYGTEQTKKVREWIQSAEDIIKEMLKLKVSVQKTNLNTNVQIEIGGKVVEKNIAEWIHRRRDLAFMQKELWESLNINGKNKHIAYNDKNGEQQISKLIIYFDPSERDQNIDKYIQEPSLIDGVLEVKNATTDIIE